MSQNGECRFLTLEQLECKHWASALLGQEPKFLENFTAQEIALKSCSSRKTHSGQVYWCWFSLLNSHQGLFQNPVLTLNHSVLYNFLSLLWMRGLRVLEEQGGLWFKQVQVPVPTASGPSECASATQHGDSKTQSLLHRQQPCASPVLGSFHNDPASNMHYPFWFQDTAHHQTAPPECHNVSPTFS